MAKKVTIDIEVNGKMQKATLSAKKLKKALDETKASQENLDASTRKGYRAMQGSAQATSNSTKAFSKQAGVVGGLVPVYATFAANVFAVTAAFGVLKRAAALERLETSLERLGALSGRNLGALAKDLRSVADQAISAEQSLRAVSVGTSAGFSGDQILKLTEVAKGASLALGRDMGDAIDRLIRGTAKLEPEILDELGIIVRLDQAASDYAVSINKTANELSQFEKVQAFVNATITQGLTKYQKISDAVDPSPYDKLAASFADLTKEVVNFANSFLGPIIDFFATSKFALGGALTLFAGTLVKQVVPAIDEVVARNRAISAEAALAAKKSKTVITAEYKKIASELKTYDFLPPIAKRLIPEIQAGKGSIEKLKQSLKSLKASERARNTQPTNIQTEKYKEETAAIAAEAAQLEKLIAKERGRASYTQQGLNEKTTSRIAGNTAKYGEAIDQAGFLKSLDLATEGVKKNAAEVTKAGTAYGKFRAAAQTAGSAVTLFGRAFLNMLPIIGNILFAFSILQPLVGDLFSKSAAQKAIEETNDRFKIFTKTVSLVKEEIKEAKSEFTQFSIRARASVGIFDEIKQAFTRLGKAIDEELIEKYKEAIDKQREFQEAAKKTPGADARGFLNIASKASGNEASNILEQFDTVSVKDAIAVVNIAESRFGSLGAKTLPVVAQGLKNIKDIIKLTGKDGKVNITVIREELDKLSTPVANFVGNLKTVTQQFADFNKEVTRLSNAQTTPFSAALEQSKAIEATMASIFGAFFEGSEKGAKDTPISDLAEEIPGIVEQAGFLAEKLNINIVSAQDLSDAFSAYNSRLERANKILLIQKSITAGLVAEANRIKKVESAGAAFTVERLFIQRKIALSKKAELEAQLLGTNLMKKDQALVEERLRITNEIKALEESMLSADEIKLEILKAKGREEKRRLSLIKQVFDLEQKIAQQTFNAQGRTDRGALRQERAANPFAFLDENKRSLDLEIKRTEELLTAREKNLTDERKKAIGELASLEYRILEARLSAEAKLAQSRRLEILKEDPNDSLGLGEAYNDLQQSLTESATLAGEGASASAAAAVEDATAGADTLKDKLGDLYEARTNLEDINVLIDGAARSLESNMTGAFTALITGTKSAKNAFADMAKAILADIAAMIAKQLVLNMLIAATGGSGGFFANLFGRQGGVFEQDPNMRYGGVAEKVQGYAGGGIAKGRQAGYPAILHGTEAVVPLPNGKEIPVEMRNGSGQTNNVVVNVSVDSNGNAQQNQGSSSQQGAGLGKAIAMAVQKELQNQKRSGGILNPYGAA